MITFESKITIFNNDIPYHYYSKIDKRCQSLN